MSHANFSFKLNMFARGIKLSKMHLHMVSYWTGETGASNLCLFDSSNARQALVQTLTKQNLSIEILVDIYSMRKW